MDVIQLVKELAAGGFASFLVFILIAGKMRYWVWGYVLDEVIKEKNAQLDYVQREKNEWRALALEALELSNRSVNVASKVVGQQQAGE